MFQTLASALSERGYDPLTPVQEAVTNPELRDSDLLVSAQTGSGKTVGFGLAIAPTLLGRGMAATGVVYLVGSLAAVFAPGLSSAIDPFYGVAIVVEPAFAIWLMARGTRLAHPSHGTPAPVPA